MIAINGYTGFIGQALIKEFVKSEIKYRCIGRNFHRMELEGITKIIFLSSPSDKEDFKDRNQTAISMMDNYIRNLNVILDINPDIEVVFASSGAVKEVGIADIDNLDNSYGIYKLAIEHYIRSRIKNYRIIRIPRIYGKERQKGLMKFLREKPIEEFEDKIINFFDINDFIPKFKDLILNDTETFEGELNNLLIPDKRMTPKEIKKYYKL